MFPNDAQDFISELSGNVTSTTLLSIPNGKTYTVLYESMNTASNDHGALLHVVCGSTHLMHVSDFGNVPNFQRFKIARCSSDVLASISGTNQSPSTIVGLVYVPRDITETVSSTQPLYFNGMTYGETTSSLFLFLIFAILLYQFLFHQVRGQRVHE